MKIEKSQSYELDDYQFINFIMLDAVTLEQIRQWRNHPKIREVMYSKEEISGTQHADFINSLRFSESKYYWLVKREGIPVGVVSLVEVNKTNYEGQSGFYLFPDYINSGLGIDFISHITYFLFKLIGCRKIYGRIMLSNKNSLMINHLLGFEIKPEIVMINEEKFVEVIGSADSFFQNYTGALESATVLRQIKEFNKLYKHIREHAN